VSGEQPPSLDSLRVLGPHDAAGASRDELARVPHHLHQGLETVVVLDGAQADENGEYRAGAVVLNPQGSEHSVWSDEGCVVLIHWTRPVLILGEAL
jgi:anti-sigma factor ChrR (cupin superfamily)